MPGRVLLPPTTAATATALFSTTRTVPGIFFKDLPATARYSRTGNAKMIALYRGTSLVSKAIQFQTRSPYSHAGYIFPDQTIIEAWHIGGVRRNEHIGSVHTPGTVIDLFEPSIPMTGYECAAIEEFLTAQVGMKYDFRSVVRFMSRVQASANDKWFCSELVFAAFLYINRVLLKRIDASCVSPALLSLSPCLSFIGSTVTVE